MQRTKVLNINLVNQSTSIEFISAEVLKKYLGGLGVNTYLLAKKLDLQQLDPISPDNIIVFGTSPLTHSGFSCSAGYTVSTISPLNHTVYHYSTNGSLGLYLKGLGYDYIVLTGSCNRPAYLVIRPDNEVLFFGAKTIWDLSATETEKKIHRDHPKTLVVTNGPAGSNMVRFATLSTNPQDPKQIARGGCGAIFGSKNLKAIAFQTPKEFPKNNFPEMNSYLNRYTECVEKLKPKEEEPLKSHLKKYLRYIDLTDLFTKNSSQLLTNDEILKWLEGLFKLCTIEKTSSSLCPIQPKFTYKISRGIYQEESGLFPSFEEAYALGLNLGIEQASDYFHLITITKELGLDPLEMGYCLGATTDWYLNNIVDDGITKLNLTWGNTEGYETLIRHTAKPQELGRKLSQGLYRAAHSLSPKALDYCFLSKMQGVRYQTNYVNSLFQTISSYYDPNQDFPFLIFLPNYRLIHEKIFQQFPQDSELNLREAEGKGKLLHWIENYLTILRSLGICHEPILPELENESFSYGALSEMFSILNGLELTSEQLENAGRRILLLQRQINAKVCTEQDSLTLSKQIPEEKKVPKEKMERMVKDYYLFRGCNPQGLPKVLELTKVNLDPQHPKRC